MSLRDISPLLVVQLKSVVKLVHADREALNVRCFCLIVETGFVDFFDEALRPMAGLLNLGHNFVENVISDIHLFLYRVLIR